MGHHPGSHLATVGHGWRPQHEAMRDQGEGESQTMHHHHDDDNYHDIGWHNDHDHKGHHHHGDDGSTLYHQHDDKPDHGHVLDGNPFVVNLDFGPADHNHDKPAEHVHDWQPGDSSADYSDYVCVCGAFRNDYDDTIQADTSAAS